MKLSLRLFLWSLLISAPALGQSEVSFDSLLSEAMHHYYTGFHDLALDKLNEATSRYPTRTRGFLWRAQVHHDMEEDIRALSDYQAVLAMDTLSTEAQFGLGRTLYYLHRYEESVTALTKVLTMPIEETNHVVYRREAEANGASGMFTHSGLQSDIYYLRGMARWALEHWDEAQYDLEQAVDQAPHMADYHYQLGRLHEQQSRHVLAAGHYYECLLQDRSHMGGLRGLLRLQWEVTQVQAYFADLNEGEEGSVLSLTYEGLLLFQQGSFGAAIAKYNEAIELAPGLPSLYLNRGMARVRLDDLAVAQSDFVHAIRLDPMFTKAYQQLGSVYYKKREYAEAIENYDQSLRLDDSQALVFYNRGLAHYYLKEKEEACADITQAEALGQAIPANVKSSLCGG